jgi:transcriptional regulator with XRE-family HTH domain
MPEYRNLKAAIIKAAGSQSRFAERLGCHPSLISHVLRGKRRLTPEEEARWSDLLEIPVDRLFEPKQQSFNFQPRVRLSLK